MSDDKLDDGNKEAAKELLSSFRSLAALSFAIFFGLGSLDLRDIFQASFYFMYFIGMFLMLISTLCSVYMSFLVIPKLNRKEDEIIEHHDVKVTGAIGLGSFVVGVICLFVGIS